MNKTKTKNPDKAGSAQAKPPIHCIITVHGMGEPRFNSTLMPVAEQIVQAAYPKLSGDTLTLGGICGLTGVRDPADAASIPCFALEGICAEGDQNAMIPALLRPSRGGQNLFFADIFWSDITGDALEKAGDSLTHWTECLLNRLERKRVTHDKGEGNWWVMDMLYLLRRTLLFAEKALAWRSKDLSDVVFGKYLGDVQLYGEYGQCRGMSVRRFHDTMARIHDYLDPDKDQPVEFTILAHSLGTVLSMDALTLAHNKKFWDDAVPAKSNGRRAPQPDAPDSPPDIPGYENGTAYPKLDWIDSVRSFVTLGSPIDKFLTLWWFNYLHMANTDWIRTRKSGLPIKHYNFCDEQDPVGHRLDFARTAPAFAAIFTGGSDASTKWNDVVYNHTPLPGWAHVSYWQDRSLFKLILKRIIVGKDGAPQNLTQEDLKEFQVYRRGVYTWILMIHFYLIPILCIGACNFTLTLALLSEGWHTRGVGMLGFLLSAWYGRTALMINIGWRRALKNDSLNSPELQDDTPAKSKHPLEALVRYKNSVLYDRDRHSFYAKVSWWMLAGSAWIGSAALSASLWKGYTWMDLLRADGMPVTLFSAVLLTGIIFIVNRLGQSQDSKVALPASLQKDIVWGRKWETALVAFAMLPPLLMSIPALQKPVVELLSTLAGWVGLAGWKPKREYVLFLAVLAQISAVAWVEVIWVHAWMKRRFTMGRKQGDKLPLWQRSFKTYAMESGNQDGATVAAALNGTAGPMGEEEMAGKR